MPVHGNENILLQLQGTLLQMIFHHPVAAVRHVLETKKEKRRLENCNET